MGMTLRVDGSSSLSSSLMLGVTLLRNDPGIGNKLLGQAGYLLVAIVAAVETAVAAIFTALSLVIRPLSPQPFDRSFQWLKSGAFCVGWALVDFVLNPCVVTLVADEQSARHILETRQFLTIPRNAII